MRLPKSGANRFELATVAAMVALAAYLRFVNLSGRGLIYWDEAKFALEGIRYETFLRALVGMHVNGLAGKAVGTAKPTHALLIGLSYAAFGIHDYAGLFADAMASTVAILVTYAIARRLFGVRIAVITGLLLAVSDYDIVYARSDLSESDAALFFLLAVLCWVRFAEPHERRSDGNRYVAIVAAGVLMSIGFTANYRLSVYIVALVMADLVLAWRAQGFNAAAQRVPAWLVSLISAPLVWQSVGLAAAGHGVDLFRNELTGGTRSYLVQVLYQLHEGKQSVIHFQPVIYVLWFSIRETWLMTLAVILGLGITVACRERMAMTVAALLLGPYIVYVFAPFYVPRNLSAGIPFACMLAAYGLAHASSYLRSAWLGHRSAVAMPFWHGKSSPASGADSVASHRSAAGVVEMAVLILLSGAMAGLDGNLSWQLTGIRSGFASAAGYVDRHGGRAMTTTEVMAYYLRARDSTCGSPALPRLGKLTRYVESGYRLAVLDAHHTTPASEYVTRHDRLVAHYLAMGTGDLSEDLIATENSNSPGASPSAEYVRVYSIERYPPLSRSVHILCPDDRVR